MGILKKRLTRTIIAAAAAFGIATAPAVTLAAQIMFCPTGCGIVISGDGHGGVYVNCVCG